MTAIPQPNINSNPPTGTVSVYFEIGFPKLAPESLRGVIGSIFGGEVDRIAPLATRQGWLNQPYSGAMSASAAFEHAKKCLLSVGQNVTASSTAVADYYCKPEVVIICYYNFEVQENGKTLLCTATADGRQVDCPLLLVARYEPS